VLPISLRDEPHTLRPIMNIMQCRTNGKKTSGSFKTLCSLDTCYSVLLQYAVFWPT
jgi:hypothetical protein